MIYILLHNNYCFEISNYFDCKKNLYIRKCWRVKITTKTYILYTSKTKKLKQIRGCKQRLTLKISSQSSLMSITRGNIFFLPSDHSFKLNICLKTISAFFILSRLKTAYNSLPSGNLEFKINLID